MTDVSGTVLSVTAAIHWAAIISDAATVILVLATAALVWATTRYLKPSITLAREAIRARVDDQAPRVFVVRKDDYAQVWWSSISGGDPQPAEGGSLVLRIPAQEDPHLFVEVALLLMNEGVGSGYVKVGLDPADAKQPGLVRVCPLTASCFIRRRLSSSDQMRFIPRDLLPCLSSEFSSK